MKIIVNLLKICLENIWLVFWIICSTIGHLLASPWSILLLIGLLPIAFAAPDHSPISNITFRDFSKCIEQNFSSTISLATVLVVLFTTTSNPDLLNLHARQQNPLSGETAQIISGWMKALARALEERLGKDVDTLFKASEQKPKLNINQVQNAIGIKLDLLTKLLGLYPYDSHGQYQKMLKPVSDKDIEPIHVICPTSLECQTISCNHRSLLLDTRDRDVPRVSLVKGMKIYDGVHVLSGKCPTCGTRYYADHEISQSGIQGEKRKFYLNSAKYLKVGQSLWVDRIFSGAVINGTYSFHASSASFAEFWNDSFWSTQAPNMRKITRRQIWHTYVQESIRRVAKFSGHPLELLDGLPIQEVTKHAFLALGEEGVIRSAENHFCSECTHEYKKTADRITGDDPAAVIGVDENHSVPVLVGEDADLAVQDAAQARLAAETAMDIDRSPSPSEGTPVKLVVLDGVVMGPIHCAYDNCTQDLAKAQKGVFCVHHEILRGNLCRMRDCNNQKVAPSQTCPQHQNRWYQHAVRYGRQSLLGIRRIVRRSEAERLAWLPTFNRQAPQHDNEPAASNNQKDNYFVAPRFYCVETICAPCGVVIAWTKFAKAESPTNILNFLDTVYPTPELRPNYICIDKACMVLRTAISNGSWQIWKQTSRFIVDSYHYINHRTSDYLCRKWCNPAPLNGSAPNLVIVENDLDGNPHYTRAFNTQVWIIFYIKVTIFILFYRHVNS
jgi:hypothetical protein